MCLNFFNTKSQAVDFLVCPQKGLLALEDISTNLCPALNSQQVCLSQVAWLFGMPSFSYSIFFRQASKSRLAGQSAPTTYKYHLDVHRQKG